MGAQTLVPVSTHTLRWQRQTPIGRHIVDFYCAKTRLVVELDGGGHYTLKQQEKNAIRTRDLENEDLLVVRFANNQVDRMFNECAWRLTGW
ncbi:DUF559 domain-containing protein [Bifidobacterium sp. 82T10]|uniref:DUF559 domain-containing protein n=1 Tax=Bifidobacterium miconis TaxID=2834435 RepID=A0ABS6WDN1_9BIFI|nr:DUF559 domain-containing protein [Bifidobacterium miconis]MBW3091714.1 DUF559 domain-containing protein [Bifidobacterium miconis]